MFVLCTAYLRPEIYVCGDMFVLSRFMVETWRISLPGVGARDATPSHKKRLIQTYLISSIENFLHPINHLFCQDIGGLYVGAVKHVDHVLKSVLGRPVQLKITRFPPKPVPTHREVGLQIGPGFAR